MSSLGTLYFATQWGSGHVGEVAKGDISVVPFSLITPPSPPSGYAMGTYCIHLGQSSSQTSFPSALIATTASVPDTDTGKIAIGYFWRPSTNPTLAAVPLVAMENGSLTGVCPVWSASDKKIRLTDMLGNVKATTTITADTAEVYQTVTNPWYYSVLSIGGDTADAANSTRWELTTWKWGATSGCFEAIDCTSYQDSTYPSTLYVRAGFAGAASTGAVDVANLSCWHLAAGQYGPLAPSMVTGVPINKQTDATGIIRNDNSANCPYTGTAQAGTSTGITATQITDTGASPTFSAGVHGRTIVRIDGGYGRVTSVPSTTQLNVTAWVGTTPNPPNVGDAYTVDDAEWQCIYQVPSDPVTNSYLRDHVAGTHTSQQRHQITQSLITSGLNVIGQTTRLNCQNNLSGAATTTPASFKASFRLGTGTEESTASAISLSADTVWILGEVWFSSVVEPGTTTGFATGSTDTNQSQIGYITTKDASEHWRPRIAQLIQTWVYGPDEIAAAITAPQVV